MPSPLEVIIKDHIREHGPMSVGQFMTLALGHAEHGYYMKQDPFGRSGGFVTAPEVSQLFGEMVGVWVADIWQQLGRVDKFVLLECGPGRGTLMADILRAVQNVEGFLESVSVHLLEMSPVLKAKQAEVLKDYGPQWHDDFKTVPEDCPLIVIGNEFLDALAFQQFIGEEERKVVLEGDELVFVPQEGEIQERSAEREGFVQNVCGRLKAQEGAALFIDYGHMHSGAGDTFQAIKGHEYVDVFSGIGDADLTSHVDFEALQRAASIHVAGPVTQREFLRGLGIEVRTQMLRSRADDKQAVVLEKGLHRLIDSDQMGTLFKVIGFYHSHDKHIEPAGF